MDEQDIGEISHQDNSLLDWERELQQILGTNGALPPCNLTILQPLLLAALSIALMTAAACAGNM